MQPIFQQQESKVNGVFSSDKAKLHFGSSVTGVLVQGFNFAFSQNVTRLYEVGNRGTKTNIYYVGGRSQGQAQMSRVIGPNATIKQMYSTYGNVCKGCNNKITLTLSEADCCTASSAAQVSLSYKLMYCVLTQVGVSIAAQDMIINESCQIMFSGLQYE